MTNHGIKGLIYQPNPILDILVKTMEAFTKEELKEAIKPQYVKDLEKRVLSCEEKLTKAEHRISELKKEVKHIRRAQYLDKQSKPDDIVE